MAKEMVRKPKTTPKMTSLRRATVNPTRVLESSSCSVVRRRMNLRATSLASMSGFWVLVAVAMASKAEMAGEEEYNDEAEEGCVKLLGAAAARGGALLMRSDWDWFSSSSGGSEGASFAWR
mmetsp:Transcript_22482/g.45273  ORF Transcript_22482/g.45273 Transcript_22482/m.45273 type:complete len:121 (-) Transcript_22482:51-413(-)